MFILSKREDDLIVVQNVQFKFRQVNVFATLLLALRTSTFATASRKGAMYTFTHNLPLIIVFNTKSSSFSVV